MSISTFDEHIVVLCFEIFFLPNWKSDPITFYTEIQKEKKLIWILFGSNGVIGAFWPGKKAKPDKKDWSKLFIKKLMLEKIRLFIKNWSFERLHKHIFFLSK